MRYFLGIATIALSLAGCVTAEERAQQQMAQDDGQCASYGAAKGSPAYVQCRMQQDQQRQQRNNMILGAMIENNRQSAQQPAYQMPATRPNINCTTMPMGGGMTTTNCN